jgi:hypothetical protein
MVIEFESLAEISALLGVYADAVDAVQGQDGGVVSGISIADNGQSK